MVTSEPRPWNSATGLKLAASSWMSCKDAWVVANYKETQLGLMLPGQRAAITVDAIPGHKFYGWVDSFSPGSGTIFALLPSDNATGNFTKIVQRVPVKIVFDPGKHRGYESRLVAGLSVEISVDLKSVPQGQALPQNQQIHDDQQSHLQTDDDAALVHRESCHHGRGAKQNSEKKVSFRNWLALFGVMLGAFMAVLDIQITNSSLNDISGALGSSVMKVPGFPPPIWWRKSWRLASAGSWPKFFRSSAT
jgi:hypothetical protein